MGCLANHDIELDGAFAIFQVLVGSSIVEPGEEDEAVQRSRAATARFNAQMLFSRTPLAATTYLASPVTVSIGVPAHFHASSRPMTLA